MENLHDIGINLIAAAIAFTFGRLWKGYFSIKFFDFVYKGVKINGTWKATQGEVTARGYTLSYPSVYTFTLNQTADIITGTANAEFGKEHREIANYIVKGTIKDRFVTLALCLDEKKRISHSTFLLEVVGNGEKMAGYMCFYALLSEEINAIQIDWKKLGR